MKSQKPSRGAGSRRKIESDEEEEAQLSAAATPTQTRSTARRKIAALDGATAVEPVAAAVAVAFQPSAAVVADEHPAAVIESSAHPAAVIESSAHPAAVIESSAVDMSSPIVADVALHEKLLVYDVKVCCMHIS